MIAAETEHRRASWRPESLHFHAGDAVVLPLRIVIEPTAKGGKWIARLDGRVLCVATAPFIKSARVLLSEGYPPYAVIEMWRPNTNEWALRGRIGPVAATLLAGETAASAAKNGSPVREKELFSTGRFWPPTASTSECRPGRVSKTKRRSTYITKQQAMNLMEALEFADTIGYPLNVSIDIFWEMFSGFTDERTRLARCQERISKWSQRRGFRLTMIWVREIGKNGGRHTHILLLLPSRFIEDGQFQAALERALEPEDEKAIMVQPAYDPLGKLKYMLKGLHPRDAKEFGIRASFQGLLEGKRVGCTENIGERARRRFETSSSRDGEEEWSDLPANTNP
jgi:hypothetical protein